MQDFLNKKSEVSERITETLDFLGVSKNLFAKSLGYNRSQVIYDIVNGKAKPSFDFFEHFSNSEYSDKINIEWLLTGRGSMLREPPTSSPQSTSTEEVSLPEKTNPNALVESEHGIPLVPISAVAGHASPFATDLHMERYYVPEFLKLRADFMIHVSGDSMQPKYRHRDLVACKMAVLTDFAFLWNRVYVLSTEEGMFIKYVRKSEQPDQLLLVSENVAYQPFELHKSKIYWMALVVGGINVEE